MTIARHIQKTFRGKRRLMFAPNYDITVAGRALPVRIICEIQQLTACGKKTNKTGNF
jgi:hypothetical protein